MQIVEIPVRSCCKNSSSKACMSAAKGASPKPMPPSSPSNVSASTVLARGVMAKEVLYTLAVFGAEGLLSAQCFWRH